MGLGLGAAFLIFGMARHAADYAHELRMADAAVAGYSGSYLEAEGQGLRIGLQRYGFEGAMDAITHPSRVDKERLKARRRADLDCLTTAVYYEARGESPRGQAAVAQVVMNRVKHPAFPKSVCAVVFQGAGRKGCQFSFACDGSMRKHREILAWNRAREVATRALAGAARAEVGAATHFHTTAVSPMWAPHMLRVANVGAHVFYKFAPYRSRSAPSAAPVRQAMLTASPGHTPDLRIEPAVEKAIEASLDLAPTTTAEPKARAATGVAVPVAAEEARLAPAQPAAASS
ncbi:cell wall hydrolase [Phenylobacterium sp.]|uniref:cell wall hydrolase n=1 Tax=Phenylobacterium sp. TaxID=1871053 RepID=UPI0025FA76F9|nr:cell wall hydrolase [Phenylobacterium sp.]